MNRVWKKIAVFGLVILGNGTFTAESSQRADGSYEINGNTARQSHPVELDGDGPSWKFSLAAASAIPPGINPSYQTFTLVNISYSGLFKHHPFNPRAPPVPAS